MSAISSVVAFLEEFAPSEWAESWDNVGLLVGDPDRPARRVMTCLTITPASAAEAVSRQADLVIAHHPLPFRPLKRLTTASAVGRLLLMLIEAKIAVYSPHTAFDSTAQGINERLAAALGLVDLHPLVPVEGGPGTGRHGRPVEGTSLGALAERVKRFLKLERLQLVGEAERPARRVAVACGAAGELVEAAVTAGCDAMLLGETRFHTYLEAEAAGMGLILPGHYASERFAVEALADLLADHFADLTIWASRDEYDPVRWW